MTTAYWILVGVISLVIWIDVGLSYYILRRGWGTELSPWMRKVYNRWGLPGWIVVTVLFNAMFITGSLGLYERWPDILVIMFLIAVLIIAIVIGNAEIIYRRRKEGG